MALRTAARRLGFLLVGFGVLVLLFVAYQLWGTSITTRLHQEQLRRQFNHELALLHEHSHPKATTTTTVGGGSTTTATQPISGVKAPVPGSVPADGQPIGIIDIPAIGVNYVVVQGTDTSDLVLGPGHYDGTPLPGQPGNSAIAGHRTTYLHPFYNLNELVAGDPIYVTTTQGHFEYTVLQVTVVSPSDVAILNPTPKPELTLTTCNPRYSASQRLVVQAALVSPPASVPVKSHAKRTATGNGGNSKTEAQGLAGESGSAWGSIAWGALCVAISLGAWLVARRRRVLVRAAVYLAGAVVILVPLFFFFQSVTPLLPASY
jgi:sortase A